MLTALLPGSKGLDLQMGQSQLEYTGNRKKVAGHWAAGGSGPVANLVTCSFMNPASLLSFTGIRLLSCEMETVQCPACVWLC